MPKYTKKQIMDEELKQFELMVKERYEELSTEDISNTSYDHAKIVVEYLFKLASGEKHDEKHGEKHDIKIITDCLEKDFYDDEKYINLIKKVLEDKKVTVISMNECENSSFYKLIAKSSNGKIYKSDKEKIESLPHFILVGDSAYRVEFNDMLRSATTSFRNGLIGELLSDTFVSAETRLKAA